MSEFPDGADSPPPLTRRDLLLLLGANAALAGAAGCSRGQPELIVPYVHQPPEVTPGVPSRYATTMTLGGYGTGLVVESHEGRPTKAEGNPAHPASLGGLGTLEQASVLSVYDPSRARAITRDGVPATWRAMLDDVASAAAPGKRVHVLLEPTSSPHLEPLVDRVRRRGVLVHYDTPLSRASAWAGAKLAFGRALETRWDFARADVVLALDADFLAAAGSPMAWARGWASRRRLDAANGAMSRLYVVEPRLTTTGNERRRAPPRPGTRSARRRGGRADSRTAPRCGRTGRGGRDRTRRVDPRGRARSPRAPRVEPDRRGRRAAAAGSRPRACSERRPRQRGAHGELRGIAGARSGREQPRARRPRPRRRRERRRRARRRGRRPGVHGVRGRGHAPSASRGPDDGIRRPLRERDLAPLPLVRSRSALPRSVERRARVRRDRVDRAAAHTPPRGGQDRRAGARRPRRSPRRHVPRARRGSLEVAPARERRGGRRGPLARRARSRRHRGHRGHACTHRSSGSRLGGGRPGADPPRRRRARRSRSSSSPTPRCMVASSRTARGCRSWGIP